MEDATQKGKEKQKERSNSTHQKLPHPPPVQRIPSSSSSAEPELIQEAKRLKLSDTAPPNSGPVGSPLQAAAAQLRLMKPDERAEYKLILVGGQPIAKKRIRQSKSGRVWTPPGPSPLGPGPRPYEKVKKVVKRVMNYLNLSPALLPSSPVTAKPTLEKVILMLDEYVEGIWRTATEEEMEGLLREFQRSVDVDDEEVSWYGLMKESNVVSFWKSLSEHFICETFFESDLEEESIDDGGDVTVTESDMDDDPGDEA